MKPIYILFTVLLGSAAEAQNTTSPYSILGIGDIENKDFGKWYGMGSASAALSSPYYVNASNPASLADLQERMMMFDLSNRAKSSRFSYPNADTMTARTKDFAVRRISLAFRPNKNWAFSFGLKPYSTINYLLQETSPLFNNATSLAKEIDGSGGLNQVYLSYARKIGKHFNVGLTSSYYFGSSNIKTSYAGTALTSTLDRQRYDIMYAFQFQLGLQHSMMLSKGLEQRIGITVSNPATVVRRTETDYLSNDVSVSKTNATLKDFKLPLAFTAGYALVLQRQFTFSLQADVANWDKQRLDYPSSYTAPSKRFSAGFEYANQKKYQGQYYEDWYLQAGASYEESYMQIKNKALQSTGFTVGVGKNLSSMMNVYTGLEWGWKGNRSDGQIRENYTQFVLGVTLKEFWFNYRKFGRYQ